MTEWSDHHCSCDKNTNICTLVSGHNIHTEPDRFRSKGLRRSNISSLLHLGFSKDDVLVHDRVELAENKLLGVLNGALLDNIEETSTSLTQHLNKKVLKLFLWERMVRIMFKIQMCVNIQN